MNAFCLIELIFTKVLKGLSHYIMSCNWVKSNGFTVLGNEYPMLMTELLKQQTELNLFD